MSALFICKDNNPVVIQSVTEHTAITEQLAKKGVQFEAWQANQVLADDADQDAVMTAYQESIDTLSKKYNFSSVDVVSLNPDHPDKAAFRSKFLAEHTHVDFEIRFFVDGRGLFYLHLDDEVYMVMCEKGDLISVPANTTHWFDMGENPSFKCIRFFTTENGWEGNFTGSDIATTFPSFDDMVTEIA
ncbi:MAG: cupin [Gammaproteobacteria bacterium]|nr:cupin [Gammaproteobacteria bacterium]